MDIRAIIILADFVRVSEGKLDVIGGGWDVTSGGVPSGVGVKISVPWDQTNRRHTWSLDLLDSDGNAVMMPTHDGGFSPLKLGGEFEVGRPAGVPAGTRLPAFIAVNLGPLPLVPGKRYMWHLTINHHSNEDWDVTFTVVAPPEGPMRMVG